MLRWEDSRYAPRRAPTNGENELEQNRRLQVSRSTHNLVCIHDGLETMRDREERHVLAQLLTQGLLNDLIRLII